MVSSITLFLSSALISLFLTFPLVWLLSFFKLGQPVRQEGPAAHQKKAGTPTLGGVGFILTIIILSFILIDLDLHPSYLAVVLVTLAFAAIGLADDIIKLVFKRNLGLTFRQKIGLQVLAAAAFALYLTFLGHNLSVSGLLAWPGFANPYLYQLLLIFMVVGSANAANLTDGLNGLLGGTAVAAFLAMAVLAGKAQTPEAATIALISAGAVGAFLYFNFPGAQVFMGDVGSLALGALLAALAVVIHEELRLLVVGGVFVVEALSVILQVSFYKLFKRRLFKMAPLHHHFELLGIREWIVVVGFWVVGVFLGLVGIWI